MSWKKYQRIFVLVIDSLGAGAMPDAAEYGDAGTDTLGHIAASVQSLQIPHLQRLGLANLHPLPQVPPAAVPILTLAFSAPAVSVASW